MGSTLRAKYILFGYMDPYGKGLGFIDIVIEDRGYADLAIRHCIPKPLNPKP